MSINNNKKSDFKPKIINKDEILYSRPRFKILDIFSKKYDKKEPKKRQKIAKIFIILVIAFSITKIVLDAILPIFDTVCKNKAKSLATEISNKAATEVMKEYTYDELFTLEKDKEGNIVMVKSNIATINNITSEIATKIQKMINEQEKEDVEISLGSFTGIKFLSGKGPDIPIKISTKGNVETDLHSEFKEQGINQTLHRVYLQVDCEISILTPYNSITEKVSNQVLLVENVIVGNTPMFYEQK